MPRFLLDPALLVPNALTLIAIGVAVYIFRKQRRFKELIFNSVGINVVEVGLLGDYDRKIKILYGDEEVENMQHVLVRVAHSGNEAIRPEDYDGPLVIDLGDEARVFQCEVDTRRPEALEVSTEIDGGRVSLGKPLLNPGDMVLLGVLVTNPSEKATLHARIADLKRVRREWASERTRLHVLLPVVVAVLLGLGAVYLGSVAYSVRGTREEPLIWALFGGMTGLFLIMTILVALYTIFSRFREL